MTSAQEKPKRLGRGLSGLIGSPAAVEVPATPVARPEAAVEENPTGVRYIRCDLAGPNRFQPRRVFDEAALENLSISIKRSGLMQPVVVRPVGDRFELVAGERRWRAAMRAGLEQIPALVRELSDQEAAEWAIVENVQRAELNPLERAEAYRQLVDRFAMTHSEIGELVGMDRSSVANTIRLTELEPEVAGMVVGGQLSAGHAKTLLGVPGGSARVELARECVRSGWNVRQLEERSRAVAKEAPAGRAVEAVGETILKDAAVKDLEKRLSQYLGTKVELKTNPTATRGKVVLEFYGLDHFDGLMEKIGFNR
jgi:ParB family chromosome partitioning protein